MRFCMVTTFYPPYSFGGDATYIRGLARGLVSRGHEVDVVHCLDAFRLLHKGPMPERPTDDVGIRVHPLQSRLGLLSPILTQQLGEPVLKASNIKQLLAGGHFDVVNFHNISLVGGPGVLRYSRAPVTLYTLHEHWLICPTHILWKERIRACDSPTCISCSLRSRIPPQIWRYSPFVKNMLRYVDRLISPSYFTAEKHRAGGITRPIEVLPLFSAINPAIEPTSPSKVQFVFSGRVTASKGIGQLLDVFSRLPSYELAVVGDGDQRKNLEKKYERYANIRFLGQRPQGELAEIYASATALVFPSLAPETFGLSVIEAAACGTPAIVRAASGGAAEIIAQMRSGILYTTEAELESALHQLANDPSLRNSLGAAAREGYEKNFTADIHLDGYEDIISRIQNLKRVGQGSRTCAA